MIRPCLAGALLLTVANHSLAADTILRRAAPNTAPAVIGPTFTLKLSGVNSYVGVAASPGSGVAGTLAGDLFLRANQKLLISTDSGSSAAMTLDAAGNLNVAGSVAAASYVGSMNSATNFTGNLAGDVTGTQGATQVATVGGQTASNVASGVIAANAATSSNTINTIAKRNSSGQITLSGIVFADGSVLSSASMRKYYLANANANGALASTACLAGFHMASIWELISPSALSYDTTRGIVYADSGSGPPQEGGWIRTGYAARGDNQIGYGNCFAWSSSLATDYGTYAYLPSVWANNPQTATTGSYVPPWQAYAFSCDKQKPVWCIQN